MRKSIKAEMNAKLEEAKKHAESNAENNQNFYEAEVARIKEEAEEESFRLDIEDGGTKTFAMYQSYIKAGFTEEQAWELTKIVVGNATKRTLF